MQEPTDPFEDFFPLTVHGLELPRTLDPETADRVWRGLYEIRTLLGWRAELESRVRCGGATLEALQRADRILAVRFTDAALQKLQNFVFRLSPPNLPADKPRQHLCSLGTDQDPRVLSGLIALERMLTTREHLQEQGETQRSRIILEKLDLQLKQRFTEKEVCSWAELNARLRDYRSRAIIVETDLFIESELSVDPQTKPGESDFIESALSVKNKAKRMKSLSWALGVPPGRIRHALPSARLESFFQRPRLERFRSMSPELLQAVGMSRQTYYDALRRIREQDLWDLYWD